MLTEDDRVRFDESCAVPYFAQSCDGSKCHTPRASDGEVFGYVDLVSSDFATKILDKYSEHDVGSDCTPRLLVNPADPESSYLIQKMRGTQTCGDSMPEGSTASAADISCVLYWISTLPGGSAASNGGAGGMGTVQEESQ